MSKINHLGATSRWTGNREIVFSRALQSIPLPSVGSPHHFPSLRLVHLLPCILRAWPPQKPSLVLLTVQPNDLIQRRRLLLQTERLQQLLSICLPNRMTSLCMVQGSLTERSTTPNKQKFRQRLMPCRRSSYVTSCQREATTRDVFTSSENAYLIVCSEGNDFAGNERRKIGTSE